MRIGIGHNQGPPLSAGRSWRRHCWARARRELLPPAPLEVVKRRVRRAAELGLSYPAYASIITITGRDLSAYLFTSTAVEGARGAVRTDVSARVEGLIRCEVLAVKTPGGPTLPLIRAALNIPPEQTGEVGPFRPTAPLRAGRDAIAELLARFRLPPAAVAMVGAAPVERDWSSAARLGGYLPAERWFGDA